MVSLTICAKLRGTSTRKKASSARLHGVLLCGHNVRATLQMKQMQYKTFFK